MSSSSLDLAIGQVPAGGWCVGVSGGADSVALLRLLQCRPDLQLHVAHLDHETRAGASTDDARFVKDLCRQLGLPCTIQTRSGIETSSDTAQRNLSARFRAARLRFFRNVSAAHHLQGVILGHHADDQAETVLLRVLRRSGPAGLVGMSPDARIGGLRIVRPLLSIRSAKLRKYLQDCGQTWREDASNRSPAQMRNRVRALLQSNSSLTDALLSLSTECRELVGRIRAAAPTLDDEFPSRTLADLPRVIARESARRWMLARSMPAHLLLPETIERLIDMAADAATPARQTFPGNVMVHRRAGRIAAG